MLKTIGSRRRVADFKAAFFRNSKKSFFILAILALSVAVGAGARSAELPSKSFTGPAIAAASEEGELAMKSFQLPPGLKAELIAAEPHLANPVAFYIDDRGRFYVVETFRLHDGVTDIRGKNSWLDEDLASTSVDDRLAMMERHLAENFGAASRQTDQVRLLQDKDGDGRVDHATVFADGFNAAEDGIAAGVLARGGDVWLANIPHLWLLRDSNGDGVAEYRRSLHFGYGVRVGFLGHDLHGLCFGPDGRLYFSIGDRGANVKVEGGRSVGRVDTGAVFRCNPDGSELELFAFGLRNPQELAFDQWGNLFTGDNNSDGGDRARWVYLVEGGDSGWRIGYQFIQWPNARGPWNSEKLWHPPHSGQAAYLVPPIVNLADGPSGLAYYPGTGLPEKYHDHFFLADFHGGKGSGIHAFTLRPKGAAFELAERENFLWEGLPTDLDFGPQGGLYYTDWVQGWGKTGKGRIYRIFDPLLDRDPVVQQTRRLLAEGVAHRPVPELVELLAHRNMRVRREAQFALAEKGGPILEYISGAAMSGKSLLQRVHALWALGQMARRAPRHEIEARTETTLILRLASDPEAEVRAQAIKTLGDLKAGTALPRFVQALKDPSPRVRFFAAIALGRTASLSSNPAAFLGPIYELLRENADADPYLRHAGVMALAGINEPAAMLSAAKDSSPAVRMGVLLALRRLEHPEIVRFLHDPDPRLVDEAARAINDQPINAGVYELAALSERTGLSEVAVRRVINANFRLGMALHADRLAKLAANPELPTLVKVEALEALRQWGEPSGRDRVTGLWRPIPSPRNAEFARTSLEKALPGLLGAGAPDNQKPAPEEVKVAAIRAAGALRIASAAAGFTNLLMNAENPGAVRVASLYALRELNDPALGTLAANLQSDPSEQVRREALRIQSQLKPAGAVAQLSRVLENGAISEKQVALAALGEGSDAATLQLLSQWLDRLNAGQVPLELRLDVIEAAATREHDELKAKLQKYEDSRPKRDPLAQFQETLQGGTAEAGRKIFYDRAEAACFRCHKINGEGGEVGPDLTGISAKQSRQYLLESIVTPNKQIAAGFESVTIATRDGITYAGVVKSENEREVVLNSPEDGLVTIPRDKIQTRQKGLSAMPEGLHQLLTKRELRDLIEFLSTLK